MNKKVARAGLTVVSTAGFLLFGSCNSFQPKAPRDDIFNNRGGHMPPPTRSGGTRLPASPIATEQGNSILLNDVPNSSGSGIIIVDKSPINVAPVESYKAPEVSSLTYTVKRNDSLWKVANNHGVSVDELARANDMPKTSGLKIGQKLSLPNGARYNPKTSVSKKPSNNSSSGGSKYTVKKGDSLSVIAWRYKTSIKAIKSSNGLKSDSLRIGQKLVIPGGNKPRTGKTGSSSSLPNVSGNVYTVKKGDSLSVIAQRFGTTSKALKSANGLKNNNIIIGKKLVIPSSAERQPGEASPIQESVKTSLLIKKPKEEPKVEEFVEKTEPNPFEEPPVETTPDETPEPDETPVPVDDPLADMTLMDVLVVESDTLDSLSNDFNTTKELILKANQSVKSNGDLKPGMVIKVPRAQ
jgi:LysM repeat protein